MSLYKQKYSNDVYHQRMDAQHSKFVYSQFRHAQKKKFEFERFISNSLIDSKEIFKLYLTEKRRQSLDDLDRILYFLHSYNDYRRSEIYSANRYWIHFDYYDYEQLYKNMEFVLHNSKQIIRCLKFKEHLTDVRYAPFVLLSLIRSNKLHMCMLKVIYSYFYSLENERNNAIKHINKTIYPLNKKVYKKNN